MKKHQILADFKHSSPAIPQLNFTCDLQVKTSYWKAHPMSSSIKPNAVQKLPFASTKKMWTSCWRPWIY